MKILLKGLLITALLSGFVASANATIITSATGISGYTWLEFEHTRNMSRHDVETTLLGAGQTYDGYRYATAHETALLLASYFEGNLLDHDDGWEFSTYTAASAFITDFGSTFTPWWDAGSYYMANFYYDIVVQPHATFSRLGTVGVGGTSFMVNKGFFGRCGGVDETCTSSGVMDVNNSRSTEASLLVKAESSPSPVPEPATMLLFGTGLVALVGSKLHRKKK